MRLISLILVLLPLFTIGQDSIISYSKIVEVPGVAKAELFTRARQWLNQTFVSSKEVLEIADKETGELSGKAYGKMMVTYKMMGTRSYESDCRMFINIFVKDGKYKYEMSNFETNVANTEKGRLSRLTSATSCPDKWDMTSQKKMDEIWASAKDGAISMSKDLGKSLEAAMAKTVTTDF